MATVINAAEETDGPPTPLDFEMEGVYPWLGAALTAGVIAIVLAVTGSGLYGAILVRRHFRAR